MFEMALQNESLVRLALARIDARQQDYRLYREYYAGNQRLSYLSDRFRDAYARYYSRFADNVSQIVVDVISDRLRIGDITAGNEQLDAILDELRDYNNFDLLASNVHREAVMAGQSHVIVWRYPDEDMPRLMYQSGNTVDVIFDEDRPERALLAVKTWVTQDKRRRLTIYYPDRVERYLVPGTQPSVADASTWLSTTGLNLAGLTPYEEDGSPWLVPNPYGVVPVVPFINNGDSSGIGVSELSSIIPLQDALNKSHADMMVVQESYALPQRYALGLMLERDENGRPINPFQKSGGVWVVGDSEVQMGQFTAADLQQSLAAINDYRQEVARVSGVPAHLMNLSGDFPSGEALRVSESRLVSKVRNRQMVWGESWERALTLALRMMDIAADGLDIECRWQPAESVSAREEWETANLQRQAGMPLRSVLRERGYDDEEIGSIEQEKSAEDAAASERQARLFNGL